MEHIVHSQTEGIDLTRYCAYIASIKDRLPAHVYAFASDARNFDLASPSSLHDAWLETLTVTEVATGNRREIRCIEVAISLLGPFHDRRIHLNYTGVTHYSFTSPSRSDDPRYEHTTHGDLLVHEIRLVNDGVFIHELSFDRGATLLIEFSDMRHSEEAIFNET